MSYWNYLPDNKDRQNVTEGHTVIRFRMRKPNLHLSKLNLHLRKPDAPWRETDFRHQPETPPPMPSRFHAIPTG